MFLYILIIIPIKTFLLSIILYPELTLLRVLIRRKTAFFIVKIYIQQKIMHPTNSFFRPKYWQCQKLCSFFWRLHKLTLWVISALIAIDAVNYAECSSVSDYYMQSAKVDIRSGIMHERLLMVVCAQRAPKHLLIMQNEPRYLVTCKLQKS